MKCLAHSINFSYGGYPYVYIALIYKSITVDYYQDCHVSKTLRIWEPLRSTARPHPPARPSRLPETCPAPYTRPAGTPALGL